MHGATSFTLYIFEGLAIDRPFFDASVAAERAEARKEEGKEARFDRALSLGTSVDLRSLPAPRPLRTPSPQVRPAAVADVLPAGRRAAADARTVCRLGHRRALHRHHRGDGPPCGMDLFRRAGLPHPCRGAHSFVGPDPGAKTSSGRKPWGLSPSRIWEFGDGQLENDMDDRRNRPGGSPDFSSTPNHIGGNMPSR